MAEFWIVWGLSGISIATALIAGVFMAFSDFIMRSFGTIEPSIGMEAMRSINRKVYGSVFLVMLIGTTPVSAAAILLGFTSGGSMGWLAAGGTIYLAGVFGTTVLFNVPMNNRLDGLKTDDPAAQKYWRHYVDVWTRWNHVRSIASVLSAACFLTAAVSLGSAA